MKKRELMTKKVTFVFPPSLYSEFEQKCHSNYKTPSSVIRDLISDYIGNNNENSQNLSRNKHKQQ